MIKYAINSKHPATHISEACWEVERGKDPVLRWVCDDCGLLNAEHPDQFWGCHARWLMQTPKIAPFGKPDPCLPFGTVIGTSMGGHIPDPNGLIYF